MFFCPLRRIAWRKAGRELVAMLQHEGSEESPAFWMESEYHFIYSVGSRVMSARWKERQVAPHFYRVFHE